MNQSSSVKLAALTIFIFFIGQLLSPTIFPICTIREITLSFFFSFRLSLPPSSLSLALSLFLSLYFPLLPSAGLVAYCHPAYISKSYDEIRRFKWAVEAAAITKRISNPKTKFKMQMFGITKKRQTQFELCMHPNSIEFAISFGFPRHPNATQCGFEFFFLLFRLLFDMCSVL